jgi:hypothetical protein
MNCRLHLALIGLGQWRRLNEKAVGSEMVSKSKTSQYEAKQVNKAKQVNTKQNKSTRNKTKPNCRLHLALIGLGQWRRLNEKAVGSEMV